MATVKLPDSIVTEAKRYASVYSRSVPKQIEHWFRVGKIAEENPDLPYEMLQDILLGLEEKSAGEVTPYKLGK